MYDGSSQDNFVGTKYIGIQNVDLEDVIFGAFANWVNEQLVKNDVTDLYIKIEANIVTIRNDDLREPITIPEGKSLHLQLSDCQVGNDHSETRVDEPYFLVEPGGKLEITGKGRIINTEVTNDDKSIQEHALILNYGTTEISGTIYLEREYKHTGEYSRQHTIINYGKLEIDGAVANGYPGEYGVTIDVLSTAAGEYNGEVCVGETIVKNANVEMATVFVESDTDPTNTVPSVEMTNVNVYYAFGFADAENGAGSAGNPPSSVGSFPLVEIGSEYYYHEAVGVPAEVTLENITWKDNVNGNSDACGVLLLNSPNAEVELIGTQTNLKPVIVGGQTEATVATLQNRTFLTLTLADVEDSITISGAVVKPTDNRGGYIKLNNSKNVTLDNCTADAIILADGYLRDDNSLAPNDVENVVVDVGLPSDGADMGSDITNATLVKSTINSVYLYQNDQTSGKVDGTVGLTIQSGVYGFTQEELKSEMKKKYDGNGSVVMDGVKAQATVTVDGDTKNIYAKSNEELLGLINKQEPKSGDTVEITAAEEGLVLAGYPAGVKVVNSSDDVTIKVNNKELESGKDYTVCYIQANVIVDGVKTVINANDNEELLAEIQKLNPQAGDTVEITAAEEGLVLAGYPAGVKVVNSSDVTIKVNNKELEPNQSYTVYYAPIAGIVVDQGEGGQTEDGQTEEVYYLVTCDTLNVRSGAGTQYGKLGTLSRGTKLTGQMENGWLKFSYEGQTAYCCGDYLQKVTGTPDGLTVICRTLNVRSGPGTSYSKIGTLSRGTVVDVLETLEGWYKIAFGDGEGYVSALYLG